MRAIPLPLETFDGGHVVASTYIADEPDEKVRIALVVIVPQRGRVDYVVVQAEDDGEDWHVYWRCGYPNIVPAVAAYVDEGGDN